MGGSSGLFGLLIFIIPIALIWYFVSKRKKKKNQPASVTAQSKSEKKDEVWRTVKQYLQDHNERGKEVSYSFVAKRNNPLQDKKLKKSYQFETEDYIQKNSLSKLEAKKYREKRQKQASKELYCIYFISRDAKTRQNDPARIIEAEVVQSPNAKKAKGEPSVKRNIVVNGLMDFETEFKWIEPIKKREDEKIEKMEKQRRARTAKKKAAQEKKQLRKMQKQGTTVQTQSH
ncbi:DUF5385 family protein [[Mycoplasma] testudinis]|uniref:DUF5385 family protein n=1 Tax=[Mycoplasma] testudinis TaxID=33924 RepID=UPI000A028425|nr:DUF5385 family protein [[Mycoplasma] testudinis]